MPYSGIGGAVGMAVESQFCTAPLTGSASPYTLGSTENPLRFFTTQPGGGLNGESTLDVKPEIDGGVERKRITLTGKTYQGNFSWLADTENLYYPLLGILGRDMQSSTQAGVYTHLMRPGSAAPSFTMEEQMGDPNWARLSSGVMLEGLDIELSSIITARMTLRAHRQIPNTYPSSSGTQSDVLFGATPATLPVSMGGDGVKTVIRTASPAFVDLDAGQEGNGPLVFAQISAGTHQAELLTANGSPVNAEILPGSRISIARTLDSRQTAGSGFDPGAVVGGLLSITGRLVCLYEDFSLPASMLAFRQVALNFAVTGSSIGTTGTASRLEIWLPHIKLQKVPLMHTAGAILIDADFTARLDPVSGSSIQISLTNGFNTSGLSGQSSGSTGGLSGWTAS